ncbi:MAG TPA: Uma2 family endonuclease [Tepidisphaeraceae bacterium]|nr:Uma2 family endonuclease [Tepidisphaeraceae bacterium]
MIPRKIGIVTGASGAMRLAPGLVLSPDAAFVSRTRLRDGKVPSDPIPDLAPDLAVEVLSKNNTVREMERKRRDYFDAGVRLVWIVDPVKQTVAIYLPGASEPTILRNDQTLTGEPVLPGFTLDLRGLFEKLAR